MVRLGKDCGYGKQDVRQLELDEKMSHVCTVNRKLVPAAS